MNNSLAFSIFTVFCNHHLCLVLNYFCHLQIKSHLAIALHSPPTAQFQPLAITHLLSVSINWFAYSGYFVEMESDSMGPFVSGIFHLGCFSEVYSPCSLYQHFLSFHGWMIFCCVDAPQFVTLSNCWWTFGLFLPFGKCKLCNSSGYECTFVCKYLCEYLFSVLWVST